VKQIDSEKKIDRLKLCKLLKTIYSNNTTEEINFISNQLLQILDDFSEKSAYEEIRDIEPGKIYLIDVSKFHEGWSKQNHLYQLFLGVNLDAYDTLESICYD